MSKKAGKVRGLDGLLGMIYKWYAVLKVRDIFNYLRLFLNSGSFESGFFVLQIVKTVNQVIYLQRNKNIGAVLLNLTEKFYLKA